MPRVIEVIVSPTGQTTVQTRGFVGGDCLQASKIIEQALGKVTADAKTGEFYQANQNQAQEIQQ